MLVHLRQYLIGPEVRLVRPDWRSRALPAGRYLSYCPTLPVNESPHGTVLGDAIATDDSGRPESWAGRWILVDAMRLRLDTCGLLACHFRLVEDRLWLSSSPEILRELEPELPMHADRLDRDRRVMDWYPPPHSAIEGIGRVLPSQAISYVDGSVVPVQLPTGREGVDYQVVLARSSQRLVTAIRSTAALAEAAGGRIWIGLTAGHDSRTLLAAAVAAGVDVMTYTFIRDKTSPADRALPAVLAKAAGYEHIAIPLESVDAERAAAFDRHTAASYAGGARVQYVAGGWDQIEPAAIALEGGCYEVARCAYWYRLPRDLGTDAGTGTDTILQRFPSQRPGGVRAWVDWILGAGHQAGLDWRDRFYLEQRCGGALASGLQGFDITGRRMVYPADCHALLADLLSAPEQLRLDKRPQDDLVEALAPALAVYPYNPGSRKGESARKEAAAAQKTRGRDWHFRRPRG